MRKMMSTLMAMLLCFTMHTPVNAHNHINQINDENEEMLIIPVGESYEGPMLFRANDNLEEMGFAFEEEILNGLKNIDKNLHDGYLYIPFINKLPINMEFISNFIASFSPYYNESYPMEILSKDGQTISGVNIRFGKNSIQKYVEYCNEITNIINYLSNQVKKYDTEVEVALYLHDYLVVNTVYKENSNAFNAGGVLYGQSAVCQGYAYAFKYLMNKWGIECHYVVSKAMNHGWNIIKINGRYYHVDVTFDDPLVDNSDCYSNVSHKYFLVTDKEISKDHYGWSTSIKCNDSRFKDNFWHYAKSPIVNDGTNFYYFFEEGNYLIKHNQKNNNITPLYQVDYWATKDKGYYKGTFSGLFLIGNTLYFNDDTALYAISTNGQNVNRYYKVDTKNGRIYGSKYNWKTSKIEYVQSKDLTFTKNEMHELSEDVKVPIGTIEIKQSNLKVGVKETLNLNIVFDPYYPTLQNCEFVIADPTIAQVINKKSIKGLKNGTTTLQIKLNGKIVDECKVIVGTGKEEAEVVYGDVSGDGKINQFDRLNLSRYLAKWQGYENINAKNSDVTNDGKVNQLDRLTLSRYLAKWQGYESLPKK